MHINYIYNHGVGKWEFTNIEALIEKGIVSKDTSPAKIVWRDYIIPDDRKKYDDAIERIIRESSFAKLTYHVKSSDNKIIRFFDYCGVIKSEKSWPLVLGCLIPAIYEHDELLAAEKRIITGSMVGGMVHDMKNLLSGMTSMLEFCISKLDENNELLSPLTKTLQCTEEAVRLISSALLLTRGITMEEASEELFIADIVASVEPLIRCILPASVILEIKISDNLPAIYGNRSLLYDILLNLCLNARDAMKEKGNILKISASSVVYKDIPRASIRKIETHQDSISSQEEYVKLSIEDNGCGMDEKTRSSLFEAFYSTKSAGTGLGLWMVKETVLNHFNGAINIESVYGEGSVFEIFLPAKETEIFVSSLISEGRKKGELENKEKEEEKDNLSFPPDFTVLVAEDESLIRTGVCSWLENMGVNILSAEDGESAYKLFMEHKHEINLIIQDYMLPFRKGDELIKIFKRHKKGIPIILISADSAYVSFEEMKTFGADAILEKPFKMDTLLKIIKNVL